MIETIDWEADPITITGDLFDQVRTGVRDNRILAEWGNPALSGTLHAHFQSEAREADYPFHQFLITTIATKLADAGFDEAEVARLPARLLHGHAHHRKRLPRIRRGARNTDHPLRQRRFRLAEHQTSEHPGPSPHIHSTPK